MLVETISNRKFGVATSRRCSARSTWWIPARAPAQHRPGGTGTPCVVNGRVVSTDGNAAPRRGLDVWQANDQGFYDVQSRRAARTNGRGLFTADENGEFWFRTIVPSYYPIPTDGPVGELLLATGRHAFPPGAHHFIVTAPATVTLTTHIFVAAASTSIDRLA